MGNKVSVFRQFPKNEAQKLVDVEELLCLFPQHDPCSAEREVYGLCFYPEGKDSENNFCFVKIQYYLRQKDWYFDWRIGTSVSQPILDLFPKSNGYICSTKCASMPPPEKRKRREVRDAPALQPELPDNMWDALDSDYHHLIRSYKHTSQIIETILKNFSWWGGAVEK